MKLSRVKGCAFGYFTFLVITFLPALTKAQPTGGGPGGGPPPVPISGIELLIVAGGLWGAKKIFENRRKKRD